MSGRLLDTSALIALREPGGIERPETVAVSVITIGELHAGVKLAGSAEERAARQARLATVTEIFAPLPVDTHVAQRYGDVLATTRRAGRTEKATDLLIVATAMATGRTLYTLDTGQAGLAEQVGVAVRLSAPKPATETAPETNGKE